MVKNYLIIIIIILFSYESRAQDSACGASFSFMVEKIKKIMLASMIKLLL